MDHSIHIALKLHQHRIMASSDHPGTGTGSDGTHSAEHAKKPILLNAFDMFTPTHMNFGQWKVIGTHKSQRVMSHNYSGV